MAPEILSNKVATSAVRVLASLDDVITVDVTDKQQKKTSPDNKSRHHRSRSPFFEPWGDHDSHTLHAAIRSKNRGKTGRFRSKSRLNSAPRKAAKSKSLHGLYHGKDRPSQGTSFTYHPDINDYIREYRSIRHDFNKKHRNCACHIHNYGPEEVEKIYQEMGLNELLYRMHFAANTTMLGSGRSDNRPQSEIAVTDNVKTEEPHPVQSFSAPVKRHILPPKTATAAMAAGLKNIELAPRIQLPQGRTPTFERGENYKRNLPTLKRFTKRVTKLRDMKEMEKKCAEARENAPSCQPQTLELEIDPQTPRLNSDIWEKNKSRYSQTVLQEKTLSKAVGMAITGPNYNQAMMVKKTDSSESNDEGSSSNNEKSKGIDYIKLPLFQKKRLLSKDDDIRLHNHHPEDKLELAISSRSTQSSVLMLASTENNMTSSRKHKTVKETLSEAVSRQVSTEEDVIVEEEKKEEEASEAIDHDDDLEEDTSLPPIPKDLVVSGGGKQWYHQQIPSNQTDKPIFPQRKIKSLTYKPSMRKFLHDIYKQSKQAMLPFSPRQQSHALTSKPVAYEDRFDASHLALREDHEKQVTKQASSPHDHTKTDDVVLAAKLLRQAKQRQLTAEAIISMRSMAMLKKIGNSKVSVIPNCETT